MKQIFKNLLISCTILAVCLSFCACAPRISDFYIFNTIEECEIIESEKSENAIITIYDSPKTDKNLKDLAYNQLYAVKYDSDELDFEIFAYEFSTSDSAKKYFENNTGIETELNTHYLASGGITKYKVVVIDGCNAYYATTAQKDYEEMMLYFEKVFSKQID